MSEIWGMLRVAARRGKLGVEVPRDFGWIDQPLQFERLEPATAIADDDPAPGRVADISSRAVERPAEPHQRVAGFAYRRDGRAFARISIITHPVTARPKPGRPLLLNSSEERTVGKACVSLCRYRWSPTH